MANLIYKGLKANLPAERNVNSFYLCTDTRELFFGADLYTEAVRFYDGTSMNHFLIGGTVVICRFTNNVI